MFPNWYFVLESIWIGCFAAAQIWSYAISSDNVATAVARADIYSLRVHVTVIAIALSRTAFTTRWTVLLFLVSLLSDAFNLAELVGYSAVRDVSMGLYIFSSMIASYQLGLTLLALFLWMNTLGLRKDSLVKKL